MSNKLSYDWEYNVLNVYDYRKSGPFGLYFDYIRLNHRSMAGDIVESGVFQGRTLIATAMLLKELGSDKKVYGFDSFRGFPPIYAPQDDIAAYESLHERGCISEEHYRAVQRNSNWKRILRGAEANVSEISKSSDFSDTSRELVERKMDILELDNIVLVEGDFAETMQPENLPNSIFSVLFDSDLYSSYMTTFGAIWPLLNSGGYCQFDEYYSLKFPGARIACDEFLSDKEHQLVRAPLSPSCEFERWGVVKLS